MPRVLVLDNYDSFTFNLVELLRELGCSDLEVVRNDQISVEAASAYDRILLSPGPGLPCEAGIMPELVRRCCEAKPILGVCLGHQCIAEVFGGRLVNLPQVVHGKGMLTRVTAPGESLFESLPREFTAGRYHSWVVSREGFPDCLEVTAEAVDGAIMALSHRSWNVKGLQFHPESVLTECGTQIMRNWLR